MRLYVGVLVRNEPEKSCESDVRKVNVVKAGILSQKDCITLMRSPDG